MRANAWDMERFKFLDEHDHFDSVHPSLHRISKLNNNYGLYEVTPGIYQVRGLDLTDISFVRGKKGWIAIDPMTAAETARAALKLFQEHVGRACRHGGHLLALACRSLGRRTRRRR
jgi:alkyl sulfatase BDS1-like metallo-beta-lactamase superfamily hydrolase